MATRPDFSSLNVPPNGPAIGAAVMQWITEAHEIAVGSTLPATGDFVGQLGAVGTGTSLRVKVWTGSAWADLGDRINSAAITALQADTGWTAISRASGWSGGGSGEQLAGSRVLAGREVWLRGYIAGGSIDSGATAVVGTLAVGHRPPADRRFPLIGSTSGNRVGHLLVGSDGTLTAQVGQMNPSGGVSQVWLDNVRFLLD